MRHRYRARFAVSLSRLDLEYRLPQGRRIFARVDIHSLEKCSPSIYHYAYVSPGELHASPRNSDVGLSPILRNSSGTRFAGQFGLTSLGCAPSCSIIDTDCRIKSLGSGVGASLRRRGDAGQMSRAGTERGNKDQRVNGRRCRFPINYRDFVVNTRVARSSGS